MEKAFDEDTITLLKGIHEVLEIAAMSRSVKDGVEVRSEFFSLLSEELGKIIAAVETYYHEHEHLSHEDELPFRNIET